MYEYFHLHQKVINHHINADVEIFKTVAGNDFKKTTTTPDRQWNGKRNS